MVNEVFKQIPQSQRKSWVILCDWRKLPVPFQQSLTTGYLVLITVEILRDSFVINKLSSLTSETKKRYHQISEMSLLSSFSRRETRQVVGTTGAPHSCLSQERSGPTFSWRKSFPYQRRSSLSPMGQLTWSSQQDSCNKKCKNKGYQSTCPL